MKKLWKWLRKTVLNRDMFIWLAISECIFWSPVAVGIVLGFIINKWWFSVSVGYIAFWGNPLTPAIALQVALALGLKKIFKRGNDEKS